MGGKSEKTNIWAMKYESKLTKKEKHVKVYFEQLDTIMKREDLHNIALTGNRGSGKSSIIHSYDNHKNHRRGERFLYISLAEFEHYMEEATEKATEKAAGKKSRGRKRNVAKAAKKSAGNVGGTEEIEYIRVKPRRHLEEHNREKIQKKLEYSMLCQILSKCTKDDLRNSSLRAIPEVRETLRRVWLKYAYAFALFMLVCGLVYEERFGLLLRLRGCPPLERVEMHAVGYVAAFVLLFGAAAYLFNRKPGAFRLGKISIKMPKAEAEIIPSEEVFCLDHYRFELVYILNQIASKIDYTVVIEDLEFVSGCCAEEIMSKLRELNLLINTHRLEQYRKGENRLIRFFIKCKNWLKGVTEKEPDQEDIVELDQNRLYKTESWINWQWFWKGKDCAKPVRFIYAISDETFDEEERTKFFDTILPVTPSLNIANSEEIIKNLFTGKAGMAELEAYIMMDKISRVVTDYRLLNDIRTEYEFFSKWHDENRPLEPKKEKVEKSRAGIAKQKGQGVASLLRRLLRSGQSAGTTETSPGDGSAHTEDEERKDMELKQYEIERNLIAIAVYKALLPLEYHYAFTRKGGGELINPKEKRIEGKEYDDKVVELIDFLFSEGYLNMQSLVLIGYSREALRQQWEDILTNGSEAQRRDFLNRFDPANEGREQEAAGGQAAIMKAVVENPHQFNDIENIETMAELIFGEAENALRAYYSKLFDNKLTSEGLLNLLICLSSYGEDNLRNAKRNIFSVEQTGQCDETTDARTTYLKMLEEDYQKRLRKKINEVTGKLDSTTNMGKKWAYVQRVKVIEILQEKTAAEETGEGSRQGSQVAV